MRLRKATWEDRHFLLSLRNDPETVRQSFSGRLVDPVEHRIWLDRQLRNPNMEIFIAHLNPFSMARGEYMVGAGRLEYIGDRAELSLTIDRKYRGTGIGRQLIRELIKVALEKGKKPFARIKPGNIASIKAFTAAGMIAEEPPIQFELPREESGKQAGPAVRRCAE